MSEIRDNLTENKKSYKFTPYKIIVAVCYALVTLFLLVEMILVLVNPGSNFNLSFGLFLAIIVIIIGCIAYGVCSLLSTVGLILSAIKRKDGCQIKTIVYFGVFSALPIVTELIFILTCKLILG